MVEPLIRHSEGFFLLTPAEFGPRARHADGEGAAARPRSPAQHRPARLPPGWTRREQRVDPVKFTDSAEAKSAFR
jgi:hypothetical protein